MAGDSAHRIANVGAWALGACVCLFAVTAATSMINPDPAYGRGGTLVLAGLFISLPAVLSGLVGHAVAASLRPSAAGPLISLLAGAVE
jgi:hypothetical protein